MRFSHVLLGLVGLAGLAAAAPTSASASVQVVGGVDSSPVDAAGKVPVHARAIEDRPVQTLDAPGLGQGLPQETPIPLNVGNVTFCDETQCVILHSLDNQCTGVSDDFRGHIKQITQGIGSHCYYYTCSTCDPKTLIHQTTAKPDSYIALAGDNKDIASVTCEPTVGYMSACKAASRCMSFSALDKWFELNKDYSHQFVDITQRAGAYCRYYTGFGGSWLFDKLTPTKEGDQRIVNNQVKDVGLIWCSLETPRVIFCKTAPSPTGSCSHTTELGKCKQLDASLAHQVNNITQIAGSYCKFYDNCGGRMVFDSHSRNGDAHYIGDTVLSQVGGVYCELEAKAAELQTTTHTLEAGSTPLVKKAIAEAVPTTDTPVNTDGKKTLDGRAFKEPGDTIVCHLKNHRFCHENRINALKQCANFDPNDGGPSSLKQYRGVYCKWFNDFGCRSDKDVLPLIINSLEATVEVGDLGTKYNNRLKSVKCEIHEW